jgi:hypothetical protein
VIQPSTEEAIERGIIHFVDFPQQYNGFGFGSGFIDVDNDGDPDVVLLGRSDRIVSIYENDGTGHFISRTGTCGIPVLSKQSAFAAADYDGDGYLDLFIVEVGGTCKLFRNNHDWTFTDVTPSAGCTTAGHGKGAAWADIDGDGDLDLHIAVYRNAAGAAQNIPSAVYRNNGNGTFTNISASIPGFLDPAYSFTGTGSTSTATAIPTSTSPMIAVHWDRSSRAISSGATMVAPVSSRSRRRAAPVCSSSRWASPAATSTAMDSPTSTARTSQRCRSRCSASIR